jgi:hypothetical protein
MRTRHRETFRRQSQQTLQAGESHPQATHRAAEGQYQALRQRLANQAPASRSQCSADGDFPAAPGGARQHQAGDIRAGDEQHKTNCAQQHQHGRLGVAGDEIREGQQKHAPGGVLGIGCILRAAVAHAAAEHFHERVGSRESQPGL